MVEKTCDWLAGVNGLNLVGQDNRGSQDWVESGVAQLRHMTP